MTSVVQVSFDHSDFWTPSATALPAAHVSEAVCGKLQCTFSKTWDVMKLNQCLSRRWWFSAKSRILFHLFSHFHFSWCFDLGSDDHECGYQCKWKPRVAAAWLYSSNGDRLISGEEHHIANSKGSLKVAEGGQHSPTKQDHLDEVFNYSMLLENLCLSTTEAVFANLEAFAITWFAEWRRNDHCHVSESHLAGPEIVIGRVEHGPLRPFIVPDFFFVLQSLTPVDPVGCVGYLLWRSCFAWSDAEYGAVDASDAPFGRCSASAAPRDFCDLHRCHEELWSTLREDL